MAAEAIAKDLLPGTKKNKPIDIVGFVSRYFLVIVVFGFFGFSLLMPFALLGIKPYYKADARLKIDPIVETLIGNTQESSILNQYREYIRTQAIRLRDYDILSKAIEKLSPKEKESFFPKSLSLPECVEFLDNRLYIKPISRTHLIALALQGGKPDGLASILNNIMEVYIERAVSEQEGKNTNRLAFLRSEYNKLEKKIEEKTKRLMQLVGQSSTSTFAELFNIYYKKAENLQQELVKLHVERVKAQHLYSQKQAEKKELLNLSLDAFVREMVENDWGLDNTQSWTYQQLQNMRERLDGLTLDNPDRAYVEQRMKAMKDYENKMLQEVKREARIIIYGKRKYELQKALIKIKHKYESLEKAETELRNELIEARKEAARNSIRLIEGEELQAELRHLRELFFRLHTRITELGVQSKAPSRVSIEAPARRPLKPAGTNAKKLVILCFVLSFGAVGGGLLVLDFMDNRIRSPKNVQQALGAPPTWPISRAPEGVPFARVTLDHPASPTAKAIRSLAIRLHRDMEHNGSKVFVFSGVEEQTGATEILLNTAHILGQMLPSVLIIEGTSRHPTLRDLLGVDPEHPGLNEVVSGQVKTLDAVYTDFERNVNILFASATSGAPQASLMLKALIAEAKRNYDLVLIDTEPIMTSDLSEYLTLNADVAVMVIQGDRTMYRDVRRAAELLIRLDVPAMAAVLNWGGPKYVTWLERKLRQLPWKWLHGDHFPLPFPAE